MPITVQETVAQSARRLIGLIAHGADNVGLHHRLRFNITAALVDSGRDRLMRGGEMDVSAAVAFINRATEKATEGGYETHFTITPTLPVMHVGTDGAVWPE